MAFRLTAIASVSLHTRSAATRVALSSTTTTTIMRPASTTYRFMSSQEESRGIIGRLQDSFTDRQKAKQQKMFAEQVEKMSNATQWTLTDFISDVERSTNDWRSKLPGLSNLQQVKLAKQATAISKAMMKYVGGDATFQDVTEKLDRTNKLKVALESESTVEEVNVMIQQLQSVDIMHRIVRKRKKEGKPLPTNESSMKSLMQAEGLQAMTKKQKQSMRDLQMKKGMRGIGRGRR